METVTYIPVIPASASIEAGKILNVLGGMINCLKSEQNITVILWGNAGDGWRSLAEQEICLKPEEHKHFYFSIPGEILTPEYWDMEALEEVELLASHKQPDERAQGVLVFIE